MKSEHRHELQTNELGRYADQITSFFQVHGNKVMMWVCAGSLVLAAGIYWYRSSNVTESSAWSQFSTARNADEYADVWNNYKSSNAAPWARLREADSRLSNGIQLAFTNLETAQSELKKAKEAYQSLVDGRGAPAQIREKALYNLARCLETLSDGNETDAVRTYEQFVKEYPESIFRADAEKRITVLNSGSGQEFYSWFAKFPRPKAKDVRPLDKGPGLSEDDDLFKAIHSKPTTGLQIPDEPAKATDAKSDDKSAPDAGKAATDEKKPAGDKTDGPKLELPAPEKPKSDSADKKPE